jgi:FkbM family methyltransferase
MLRSLRFILRHPLTRDQKVAALTRYVLFHALGRLLPGPVVYPYIGGVRFLARPGMAGIVANIYTGLADFQEMCFLLHFLRDGDLFVDVGANVGAYTLLASGVCKARTIAVEPASSTFEYLLLNLRLNDLLSLVKPCLVGLGSCQGQLYFTSTLNVLNRVCLDSDCAERHDVNLVDVTSLDRLLGGTNATMLKIDVEGWEYEVVRGATATLGAPSLCAIVIEMKGHGGRYGFSDRRVHEILTGNQFAPFVYDPLERRLHAMDEFDHRSYDNTLYIRNLDFVAGRVREGPRISVRGHEL